jgi:hypothetical protein
MQNKKWAALGVTSFALALFVGTAIAASASEPIQGDCQCDCKAQHEERRENRAENREEMKALFAAGNYEAWAEVMAEKPNAEEFVTEDNFNVLVEAYQLREAGDNEAARELLESHGIKPLHKHRGFGQKGPAPEDN